MKTNSKKKVITKKKNKKGTVSKSKNIFKKAANFFKNHLKITIFSSIFIMIIITVILLIPYYSKVSSLNKVILTVGKDEYSKSDFMIYFYSVKYDYFGKDADEVSDDNMNIMISDEENITLGKYLKDKALKEIKMSSAIREYALKNNVELDDKDKKELKKEKDEYIKSIGGNSKFQKFLLNNETTEKSYNLMAETDKLYN